MTFSEMKKVYTYLLPNSFKHVSYKIVHINPVMWVLTQTLQKFANNCKEIHHPCKLMRVVMKSNEYKQQMAAQNKYADG